MLAQKVINTVSGHIPLQDFTSSMGAKAPVEDAQAAANTIDAVRKLCSPSAQNRVKLDVSSFTLISGSENESSNSKSNDSLGLDLVKELAQAARTAAPAHACSSVLAGHTSESDEYADVGILLRLGSGGLPGGSLVNGSDSARARGVLSSLGLDSLLSLETTPLHLSSETNCPVAFKASPQDADVQHLASLLARLTHQFAFRVQAKGEGEVFHFLLGQVPGYDDAWAGLLGVGTWSD